MLGSGLKVGDQFVHHYVRDAQGRQMFLRLLGHLTVTVRLDQARSRTIPPFRKFDDSDRADALPFGLGLRGAEELAAVPALVAGARLVFVLRPAGAVFSIEVAGRVHMVRAGQIVAHRTWVLHVW